MGIIKFFINQAKVVNLLVILLTVLGAGVFIFGQKESFPTVDFNSVYITTIYPGASAEEMEILVTKKVEKAVENINGADEIISITAESRSTVIFEGDPDYPGDFDEVVDEITEAVDGIRDFPDDAEDPTIFRLEVEEFPVVSVFITGDASTAELRKIADQFEERILSYKGQGVKVAEVEMQGYQDREVWVEVDPKKMEVYELDIQDIIRAIQLRNINLPGGTIKLGVKEYLIRTIGQYKDLGDIRNTVVRANDVGNVVYVKDVAKISWQWSELSDYTRVEGRSGIRLSVVKQSSGDIIKTASAVNAVMEEFRQNPELAEKNIKLVSFDDQSYFVKRRLSILASNASVGLLFVFICLIIFFDFRTSIWTALGIPISFAVAMLVANALGITLNLMSMFAFIIVVGMLVDDAVLVAENIYRHRELGMAPKDAAVRGAKEVMLPVLASVTTTIVAFLPLIYLPGIFGDFLGVIPKIVAIALSASFVESLFVLPGHLAHGKRKKVAELDDSSGSEGSGENLNEKRGWFKKFVEHYGRLLRFLLRHKMAAIALILLTSLGSCITSMSTVPFRMFSGEVDEYAVNITTDIFNPLEKTESIIDKSEEALRLAIGTEVREFISSVGYQDTQEAPKRRPYIGQVRVIKDPDSKVENKEFIEIMNKAMENIDGVVEYNISQASGGPPRVAPVYVKIYGENLDEMAKAADFVLKGIKGISNVTSIQTSVETGKDELVLNINEKKAAELGVNVSSTAIAVRNAFEGGMATVANNMDIADDDVDIVVKRREENSYNLDDIRSIRLRNNFGRDIELRMFAEPVFKPSFSSIDREDLSRVVSVTAELLDPNSAEYDEGYIGTSLEEVVASANEQFPNMTTEVSGNQEDDRELMMGAFIAFAVALFAVYAILTALFKSFIQPLIVMLIIPFGVTGVMNGLFIDRFILGRDASIGIMPMLGIVALTGVVVNGSLVLVSFINRMRAAGLDRDEAVLAAAKARLRPILITSITTVVGLIPLAYSDYLSKNLGIDLGPFSASEPFLQPMGVALVWGLLFSTFITLLILPVFYSVIDSMIQRTLEEVLGFDYEPPIALEMDSTDEEMEEINQIKQSALEREEG